VKSWVRIRLPNKFRSFRGYQNRAVKGRRRSKWGLGEFIDQWLQIRIIFMSSRIRIKIKAESWIRIRIKVMHIRKLWLYDTFLLQDPDLD
jgi:hypothetical protein